MLDQLSVWRFRLSVLSKYSFVCDISSMKQLAVITSNWIVNINKFNLYIMIIQKALHRVYNQLVVSNFNIVCTYIYYLFFKFVDDDNFAVNC